MGLRSVVSQWALGFVKEDMPINVNSSCCWIKTPISILGERIAQKNTRCGFWLHLVFVVGFGERITQIFKFSQFEII